MRKTIKYVLLIIFCYFQEIHPLFQILYYRLEYKSPGKNPLPTFSLADAHSRAHFHLRLLLNAADPRYRQLTIAQQTVAQRVWEKLTRSYGVDEDCMAEDCMDEDCMDEDCTDEEYGTDEEA